MQPGMALDITHPNIELERPAPAVAEARALRELAVMFVDIVGSTGLYESLGDMRAHRLVAATLQLMTDVTQACGGHTVKSVGDALLCTYPSAAEAARGAVAIQQKLLAQQVLAAEQVAVRVGLNFGPVVVVEGDIFGDCVNVAARLAKIAQRHQILTTATCIARLPAEHRSRTRELQLIGVRGRISYVPVWELLWRPQEPLTQRVASPAREARDGLVLRFACRGRPYELWREGDVLTLGRDPSSHVRFDNQLVSRFHARIAVRNGRFVLTDQSTNGTYVQPGSGMMVTVMREDYLLCGSGTIGLGMLPISAATESAHCASNALALAPIEYSVESALAHRAGDTRACKPREAA